MSSLSVLPISAGGILVISMDGLIPFVRAEQPQKRMLKITVRRTLFDFKKAGTEFFRSQFCLSVCRENSITLERNFEYDGGKQARSAKSRLLGPACELLSTPDLY